MMPAMRAVVNVSVGAWYPAGQDRLGESLQAVDFEGARVFYRNELPETMPRTAGHVKRAKAYAMAEAAAHYQTLLWADASVWAVRPLGPLFDYIERTGYAVWDAQQWTVGEWTTDEQARLLSRDRDELMGIPHVHGTLWGVDALSMIGTRILDQYVRHAEIGVFGRDLAPGDKGSVDPRVLGQRCDQISLSMIAWDMALAGLVEGDFYARALSPRAGGRGVCLIANGI